jgi:hypothetical protein
VQAWAGSELPAVVKSLVKVAWSLPIIPGSVKNVPSSRFWMSEVLVRFSDPTKARAPSAITRTLTPRWAASMSACTMPLAGAGGVCCTDWRSVIS